MKAHSFLRSRQSVRRFRSDPVSDDVIERMLITATFAPSAHNRQPWRFLVLSQKADKLAIADAMGARLREDRLADGDSASVVKADVLRSKSRIVEAPVVIFVFMTMEEMDAYPDSKRQNAEQVMAIQGTAMAMQNLLLAAHAEGLGACVMCAPLFCPEVITRTLATPADWNPQALITIGVPEVVRARKARKSLLDVSLSPRIAAIAESGSVAAAGTGTI